MASILVVDDEVEILNALQRVFRGAPYNVIYTTQGQDAIRIMETQDISVLLCDQNLKDINGHCVLQKSFDIDPTIVRIIMTGASNLTFLDKAINEGKIDHFLQKPCDNSELLQLIQESIKSNLLKKKQNELTGIIDYTKIGLFVLDHHLRVVSANQAFESITGLCAESIKNQSIIHKSGLSEKKWDDFLYLTGQWHHDVWVNKTQTVYNHLSICTIPSPKENQGAFFMCLIADFSERSISHKETIEAGHDPLTGLANRSLLHDRIQALFSKRKRNSEEFAAIFIDLDLFKEVNDCHGHSAGDTILKVTAERLKNCLRAVDMVCRYGGDEFIILISGCNDVKNLAYICKKIIDSLGQEIYLMEQKLSVCIGASIGGIITNKHIQSENDLIEKIDHRMYQAKATGGNKYNIS